MNLWIDRQMDGQTDGWTEGQDEYCLLSKRGHKNLRKGTDEN